MSTATTVQDFAGTELEKGDTVVALNGQTTGKVCDLTSEDGMGFVCLRPAHQSYGKGMWYAADQVYWVARPGTTAEPDPAAKKDNIWTRAALAKKK